MSCHLRLTFMKLGIVNNEPLNVFHKSVY